MQKEKINAQLESVVAIEVKSFLSDRAAIFFVAIGTTIPFCSKQIHHGALETVSNASGRVSTALSTNSPAFDH